MTVIRWEDPPEKARPSRWKVASRALSEKPGEWALVAEDVSYRFAYHSVRKSLLRHGCVVQCRVTGDGSRYSVWAMFPTVDTATDTVIE